MEKGGGHIVSAANTFVLFEGLHFSALLRLLSEGQQLRILLGFLLSWCCCQCCFFIRLALPVTHRGNFAQQ